jgi:hypothetical protein
MSGQQKSDRGAEGRIGRGKVDREGRPIGTIRIVKTSLNS